jgi:hypothetical protein
VPHSSLLRNQRGIALLYLVILFTLIGVMVGVGARMLGPRVAQGKVKETRAGMERTVQTITAWAVKNGRLPDSGEYAGAFGTTPVDSWGKPLIYAYDSTLTATATGGLCGRTATAISSGGENVAFLLVSGGDDMTITSTPAVSGAFSGVLAGLRQEDIYQIVTLNELQSRAGCAASSQGSLRIVNNELPAACRGRAYAVTLVGDGGVPPVSFTYTSRPAWLTSSGAHNEILAGTAVSPPLSITIGILGTDASAHSVAKSYVLNIYSCAAH